MVRWLKKHGLTARKLTILDALAPTVIPHSTKYVPILDKHVLSKVFDQVNLILRSSLRKPVIIVLRLRLHHKENLFCNSVPIRFENFRAHVNSYCFGFVIFCSVNGNKLKTRLYFYTNRNKSKPLVR